MITAELTDPPKIASREKVFAWQNFKLVLPDSWNPVKLEGDYKAGYALLADLTRPRLGMRWSTPTKKSFDPTDWAKQAMIEQVGETEAKRAKFWDRSPGFEAARFYASQETPGDDVWVGYSSLTNRCVQLVYKAARRDRLLEDTLAAGLIDQSAEVPATWAAFELSCLAPRGWRLASHKLNAGDLAFTFENEKQFLTVRQIALAEMALKRQPLDRWVDAAQSSQARHYRVVHITAEKNLRGPDNRELVGIERQMLRRRRFFFASWLNAHVTTLGLHDKTRDRLIFVQGTDPQCVEDVAMTVGVV